MVVGMTSMAIVAGTCSRQQPLDSSSVPGIFFNVPFGVTGIRRGTESQTLAWCEAVRDLNLIRVRTARQSFWEAAG